MQHDSHPITSITKNTITPSSMPFPKSFGLLVYPEFELLDAAGPLEVLSGLARMEGYQDITLSIISESLDPVSLGPEPQGTSPLALNSAIRWVPTHTFATAPPLDVLLVPGGIGSVDLSGGTPAISSKVAPHVDFIRQAYSGLSGRQPLKFLFSVCNGAMLLNSAGVLEKQQATTNKAWWSAITSASDKTHWIAKARWTNSGNIWTTSGVSAGTDGMLAWLEHLVGAEIVDNIADQMEWNRAREPDNDPFAIRFSCQDVLPKKT